MLTEAAIKFAKVKDARTIPVPESGCLLWIGDVTVSGYGTINLSRKGGKPRRRELAHRASIELAYCAPIPPGLQACHKCDVPRCVNPDHLFLGTHADNMRDMKRKGRSGLLPGALIRTGGRLVHYSVAKFTDDQVRAIRRDRRSQPVIAEAYGVTQAAISYIQLGKSYSHITDAPLRTKGRVYRRAA